MPYNGKIAEFSYHVERARGTAHPPVLLTMPLATGQGVLPAGLLLEASVNGLVPYVSGTIRGVLDADVDTNSHDAGLVIVHGSALRAVLKKGISTPNTPVGADLEALITLGVYPE